MRITAISIVITLAPVAALATKHPLTVDDLLAMERVDEPRLSPDGKLVTYSLRTTDLDANRGRKDLWLARVDGGGARRLTSDAEDDQSPRFSPDGRWIYFLSSRGAEPRPQVFRIAVDGGEAEQVTRLPVAVDDLAVVDAARLVLVLDVYPDAPTLEESARRDKEQDAAKNKVQAYDELLFRHWDQWEDGKRSHLFVWQPDGKAPVDLMRGMAVDAPTKPYGSADELAISADRRTLVFCAKDDGAKSAWTTNDDLWAVPLDGSRPPERLTAANQAWDGGPAFSPDGKTLAYLAMARPGFEADRRRVVLLDWPSRKVRQAPAGPPRFEAWDRSPDSLAWAPDGKSLYAVADHLGQHPVFRLEIASGKVTALTSEGSYASPLPLPGGAVVVSRDAFNAPAELYLRRADGGEKPITSHNAARVADIEWGAWEAITFKGAHGDDVHGFLMRPAGHGGDKAAKVPLALLIHGGPQSSLGNHFHYRWNAEAFAGHGYAVLLIDFHGSTGYGQPFTDAIRDDWGGAPFEDLMKGLDHVLGRTPWLDADRVVAAGASYGGYMINFINGHTDRFKALVCHDGNLDETSAYFDTEELWFPEWEHGGTPWDNPEGYAKDSPIRSVKRWKTPTLVIHGGRDYRIPDTQGMSTFTALQRRGIPSRFLYFPDENHWVLKPLDSRRWHQEVLAWIDRFARRG